MSKQKDPLLEMSQKVTSSSDFLESYNVSIPAAFPRASMADLKEFEIIHFRLFSKSGEWSLEKHRKRLMDWLPSHHHRLRK